MMMLTMPGNVDDWPSVSSSATYWGQRARNAVRTGTTSTLNWSRYGRSWWWLSLLSLLRPETLFVWEPLPPWIGPDRFGFLWIGLDWLTTNLDDSLCTRATSNSSKMLATISIPKLFLMLAKSWIIVIVCVSPHHHDHDHHHHYHHHHHHHYHHHNDAAISLTAAGVRRAPVEVVLCAKGSHSEPRLKIKVRMIMLLMMIVMMLNDDD